MFKSLSAIFQPSTFTSGDEIKVKVNFTALNITGNLLDITTVLIGSHACFGVALGDSNEHYSEIICTTPNMVQGSHEVKVHVQNIGYATLEGTINEYAIKVSAVATVTDVFPKTGSIGGGTRLTIFGTGFSYLTDDMHVDIGVYPCAVEESITTHLVCITSSAISPEEGLTVSVSINGALVSTSVSFDYSLDSTPMISGLSKKEEIAGGDVLGISGINFASNVSDISIQILKNDESFFYYTELDYVVCETLTATENITQCIVPYRGAGLYSIFVHVRGKGLSQESTVGSSTLLYKLAVDTVSPMNCGHGGGLTLNITGSGFPIEFYEEIEVKMCSSLCRVTEVFTDGLLSCYLSPSDTTDGTFDKNCDVFVSYNFVNASVPNFTYASSLTPQVTSISPTSGGTAGGTYVTIVGEGFLPVGKNSADLIEEDVVVTFDGAICRWYNQDVLPLPNNSIIVCRTSEHRTTVYAELNVFVKGKGNALVFNELTYQYVDRWSSKYTWGGLDPPLEGESVYIKEGQTVFLDVSTPVLNLILIEGNLIFEDEQDIHLQAKYIFINNGKLQIGTETNPFSHYATITLHGRVRDPEIPIYGAKVIGIRQGELDIHGQKRNITWTRLNSTAMKNSTHLELQVSHQ